MQALTGGGRRLTLRRCSDFGGIEIIIEVVIILVVVLILVLILIGISLRLIVGALALTVAIAAFADIVETCIAGKAA